MYIVVNIGYNLNPFLYENHNLNYIINKCLTPTRITRNTSVEIWLGTLASQRFQSKTPNKILYIQCKFSFWFPDQPKPAPLLVYNINNNIWHLHSLSIDESVMCSTGLVIQRMRVRFPAGRPWSCIFRNWSRFGSYNVYLKDIRIS